MSPADQTEVTDDWYELVQSPGLQQGDIVEGLTIYVQDIPDPETSDREAELEVFDYSIVMSQSCDLDPDQDTHALLCPVHTIDVLAASWGLHGVGTKWGEARTAKNFNYYPLGRCSIAGFERREALVDYKRILEVRLDGLIKFATQGPRIRLRSPYREELAQQFARKIMRIANPVQVPLWKDVDKAGL